MNNSQAKMMKIWLLLYIVVASALDIPISIVNPAESPWLEDELQEVVHYANTYVLRNYNCNMIPETHRTTEHNILSIVQNSPTYGTIIASTISAELCGMLQALSIIRSSPIFIPSCGAFSNSSLFSVGAREVDTLRAICLFASNVSARQTVIFHFGPTTTDFESSLNSVNCSSNNVGFYTFLNERQIDILFPLIHDQLELAIITIFYHPLFQKQAAQAIKKYKDRYFRESIFIWGNDIPLDNLSNGQLGVSIADMNVTSFIEFRDHLFQVIHRYPSTEDFVICDSIVAICTAAIQLKHVTPTPRDISRAILSVNTTSISGRITFSSEGYRNSPLSIVSYSRNASETISVSYYNVNDQSIHFPLPSLLSSIIVCDSTVSSLDTNLPCMCKSNNYQGCSLPQIIGGGYAAYFDGVNDIIEVTSDLFEGANSATLVAWIKLPPRAKFLSNKILIVGHPIDTGPAIYLQRVESSGIFHIDSFSNDFLVQSALCYVGNDTHDPFNVPRNVVLSLVEDGAWHHVAFTHNINSSETYYDGELVKICRFNITTNSTAQLKNGKFVHLGMNSQYSLTDQGQFFGMMDSVAYFRSYSTQEYIRSIKHNSFDVAKSYEDLILMITFDEIKFVDTSRNHLALVVGQGEIGRSPRPYPSSAPIYGDLLIVQGRQLPSKYAKNYGGSNPHFLECAFHYISDGAVLNVTGEDAVQVVSCTDLHNGTIEASSTLRYYPVGGFHGTVNCSVNIRKLNSRKGSILVSFVVTINRTPYVGNAGNALFCDGVDDYMFNADFTWPFSNHLRLDGTTVYGADPVTVEYWAYINQESIKASAVVSVGNGELAEDSTDASSPLSSRKIGRLTSSAVNEFVMSNFRVGSQSKVVADMDKYSESWVFISSTHEQSSGEMMSLYINGELVDEGSHPYVAVGKYSTQSHRSKIPGGTLVKSLMVCGWSYWPDVYHRGAIDELRIWNKVRTQKEIQRDMNRGLTGNEENLVGYWTFDETINSLTPGDLTIAKDKSKYSNDLVGGGCAPCTPYFEAWQIFNETRDIDCSVITDLNNLKKCGKTICFPSSSNGSHYFDENVGSVYGGFPCYYQVSSNMTNTNTTGYPRSTATTPLLIPSSAPMGGVLFPQPHVVNGSTLIMLNASDPDHDSLIWYITKLPKYGKLFHNSSHSLRVSKEITAPGQSIDSGNLLLYSENDTFLPAGIAYDSFSYFVSDGYLNSSTGTIIVHGYCPPGTFLNTSGNHGSHCSPCIEGSYSATNTLNQTSCTPCSAGTYQSLRGQTQCIPCETNTISNVGGVVCNECTVINNKTYDVSYYDTRSSCPLSISSMYSEFLYVRLTSPEYQNPGEIFLTSAPEYGDIYQAIVGSNGSVTKGYNLKLGLDHYDDPVLSYITEVISSNFISDEDFQSNGNLILGPPKRSRELVIAQNNLPNQTIVLKFGNEDIFPRSLVLFEASLPGTLASIEMYDAIDDQWIQIYSNEVNVNFVKSNLTTPSKSTTLPLCYTKNPGRILRLTFYRYSVGGSSSIRGALFSGYRSLKGMIFSPLGTTRSFIYVVSDKMRGLTAKESLIFQRRLCHFHLGDTTNTHASIISLSLFSSDTTNKSKVKTTIYSIVIAVSVFSIIVILVLCWVKHKKLSKRAHDLEEMLDEEINSVPRSSIVPSEEVCIGPVLGGGASGIVYRGKFRGSDVAVKKLLNTQYHSVDDIRGVLEVEAKLMSSLRHPNIVLFMACCLEKSNLCIISEFCERGSLRDVLETNAATLSWKLRLKLMLGAARGLAYLHNSNPPFLHRDIKSQNILVDASWNAKLADFGTGRFATVAQIDQQVLFSAAVGTLRWSAPETLRGLAFQTNSVKTLEKGKLNYGTPADVYSMGMVMWEIASLMIPYENLRFLFEVQRVILLGQRPPVDPAWPDKLSTLIQEAWHSDPQKRPSAQEVSERLERIVAAEIESSHSLEDSLVVSTANPIANYYIRTNSHKYVSIPETPAEESGMELLVPSPASLCAQQEVCVTPLSDESNCTYKCL